MLKPRSLAPMLMLALAALAVPAGAERVNRSKLGGVAVEGQDVVAYFTDGKPVKGLAEHAHEWNGATWRFASAAHRDLFAANPRQYAPQYGGHCAFGLSRGYLVGIDPEAWSVVDGKLYLNYDLKVQSTWRADRDALIVKADQNWRALLEKEAAAR
jgi:YHS domain-containing protein